MAHKPLSYTLSSNKASSVLADEYMTIIKDISRDMYPWFRSHVGLGEVEKFYHLLLELCHYLAATVVRKHVKGFDIQQRSQLKRSRAYRNLSIFKSDVLLFDF